jgi:transposase
MCLFSKRLEHGRFIWPSPADGTVAITPLVAAVRMRAISASRSRSRRVNLSISHTNHARCDSIIGDEPR